MPFVELIGDDKSVSKAYISRLIAAAEGKGDQGAWDVVNALARITAPRRRYMQLTVEMECGEIDECINTEGGTCRSVLRDYGKEVGFTERVDIP